MTRRETLLHAFDVFDRWVQVIEPESSEEDIDHYQALRKFVKEAPHGSYDRLAWQLLAMYSDLIEQMLPGWAAAVEKARLVGVYRD